MKNTMKAEKDGDSSNGKTNKVPIIVAMLALAGVLYTGWVNWKIQKSKEDHENYLWELEKTYEQKFDMSEETITMAGIEHIRYEINTEPSMNGFHVIPYVYVAIEMSGEKKYIPVKNQFSQEEYVAEQDGKCTLYRENTTEDLLKALEGQGYKAKIGCMIAIEYVIDGKTEVNVYDLRTGQLATAEEEMVIAVVEAWESSDVNTSIDMKSWPAGSEEQLKKLLENIGSGQNP